MAEKRRKPAAKMTSEEIARHVFPPEVHAHLKQVANPPEADDAKPTHPASRKSSKSP